MSLPTSNNTNYHYRICYITDNQLLSDFALQFPFYNIIVTRFKIIPSKTFISMTNYNLRIVCTGAIFICLFTVGIRNVFSQSKSASTDQSVWYNKVSVPPSPNAASLGKFGEVPVDKSTGIPSIEVPLLSIKEGGIEVPISLNYHAGGVKVQEEASWVGLGWALKAGGVITRSMRGMPDESHKGFLENASMVPMSHIVDAELAEPIGAIGERANTMLNELSKGYIEFEPDVFYYNYGGFSGSFMFGNHGNPINIPFDNVRIKTIYAESMIVGFELTGPDGLVYIFGDVNATGFTETTVVQVAGPDPVPYISSWYLQKIINPLTRSVITFTYDSYSYTNSVSYSSTKTYELNNFGNWGLLDSDEDNQTTTRIDNAKCLSIIKFKNGEVNFYSHPSLDGGMKLDSLKFGGREFVFNYDYFYSAYQDNPKNGLRLKLLSVFESSKDVIKDKKYDFQYSTIALPPKDSKSIDHWGFYNGAYNTSLIPNINYAGIPSGGANRNPDADFACAGMLTKIIYPTGGYSEFSFEGNTVGRYPTIDEISTSHDTVRLRVTGLINHTPVCKNKWLFFDQKYNYYNFVIDAEIAIIDPLKFDSTHDIGSIEIVNDAFQVLYSEVLRSGSPIMAPVEFDPKKDEAYLKGCANTNNAITTATLKYKQYDPALLRVKRAFPSGGIRIRQIKNFDPVTNNTTYKTYDYGTDGYLCTTLPDYYTLVKDKRSSGPITDYEYLRLMTYSSPVGGLGYSANNVSYEKVREYLGTATHNTGMIETEYHVSPDRPTGGVPYLPQLSNQWLRSKPQRETYFNFVAQDNYEKKKMVEYSYETDTKHFYSIKGFKTSRIKTDNTQLRRYSEEFAYSNFELFTFNYRLNKTETFEYFGDRNITTHTEENYFYENPNHLNPTRIETKRSDGKTLKTIFKYPLDYSSCINSCEDTYKTAFENCKSTYYDRYVSDIQSCRGIYGDCYVEFLNCDTQLEKDISKEVVDGGCSIFGSEILPLSVIRSREYNCSGKLNSCLIDQGYQSCMNALDNGYIPCIVKASIDYNICLENYNFCLLDLYTNATNPTDKAIYLMAMHNIQNTLVEKRVFLDTTEIEHYKFSYGLPDPTIELPVVKLEEKEYGNQGLFTEMSYDRYDSNLNIIQVTPKGNNAPVSYFWGYNAKYLVAKFENMEYSVIEDNKNNRLRFYLTQLDGYTTITEDQKSAFKFLNEEIRRQIPDGAMVTTYTWAPGVGVTSITDPNGITTYYQYDGLGRLMLVLDSAGSVLQKYDYNYMK